MSRTHRPKNKNRKRSANWANAKNRRFFKPITVTSEVDGMPLMMTVVDPSSEAEVVRYIEAHAMLPEGFDATKAAWMATVSEALATMSDAQAGDDARLRSIVVLGHTPTPAALDTLERHAESGGKLATVAMIAADECKDWMRRARGCASAMN